VISVIIPAYNEEKDISKTIESLAGINDLEVIIADGGSCDQTLNIVRSYSVKLICTSKGRASQCNEGVKVSEGEILLFLHADCVLAKDSIEAIKECVDKGFIGGCLKQKIQRDKIIYRLIEKSGNIRARIFRIFYGDQAIFVRRDIFSKIGGFDKVDLFEDVLFSKKLKKHGKTCFLNKEVYTSARRWRNQGIIKATLINWIVTIGFLFGVSPRVLKKVYSDIR